MSYHSVYTCFHIECYIWLIEDDIHGSNCTTLPGVPHRFFAWGVIGAKPSKVVNVMMVVKGQLISYNSDIMKAATLRRNYYAVSTFSTCSSGFVIHLIRMSNDALLSICLYTREYVYANKWSLAFATLSDFNVIVYRRFHTMAINMMHSYQNINLRHLFRMYFHIFMFNFETLSSSRSP